jgi:Holliday junction resolvasome RuvABC DNA-binding subunit
LNAVFVDVHHIELRSEAGRNEAENLITLCGAHHRAGHRGTLVIEGTAKTVRVRHADGTEYGQVLQPRALEAQTKVFSALRNLGFREGAVRAVLTQLRDEGQLAAATTEQWLRAALGRLTPRRSASGQS